MDVLFGLLLGCVIALALLGTPIVAVIALVRARRLERELYTLRRELRQYIAARPGASPPPGPASPAPVAAAEAASPAAAPVLATAGAAREPAGPERPPEPEPSPRAAPPSPRTEIDWERWIGVRGAAVVGGVFLALASVFFFQHAFTQGWISPAARVACGLAGGAAALVAAARLRARGFGWAPSALEGAGVVALYASVWAADQRYGMISTRVSFPAMALVTALACALALRHGSLFSALLGLGGGFATPLLLAEHATRTLPLFGYLLLLDLGLLLLARRRGWTALVLFALAGTFAYELWWTFPGEERGWEGLAVIATFALVFAASGTRAAASERRRWLATQALGVLVPFLFALRFANELGVGEHLWPTALLLGLLTLFAALVARQQRAPWLIEGAGVAAAGVAGLWVLSKTRLTVAEAWELAAVSTGLALVLHVLAEWERARRSELDAWRRGAAASALAWTGLCLAATFGPLEHFPALCAALGLLALLTLRHAVMLASGAHVSCAALGLGLALGSIHRGYGTDESARAAALPDARLFWALAAGLGALFLFVVPRLLRVAERGARHGAAALLVAVPLTALLTGGAPAYGPSLEWLFPAAGMAFGALVLVAAAQLSSTPWVAACALLTALLASWGQAASSLEPGTPSLDVRLALMFAAPALVMALATAFVADLKPRAWPWIAALGPLTFPSIQAACQVRFGEGFDAAGHLLVALPALAAAWRLRSLRAPAAAQGWIAAAAALALTGGIADQLDTAEFAVSVALFAAALAWVARRLALPGAGWAAAALAALASAIALAAGLLPEHHERSGRLLVNWSSYAHLVPAACAWTVLRLAPDAADTSSARSSRIRVARSAVLGACGLALVFLWLNLEIENVFARSTRLTLFSSALEGSARHARDLVTSLAWGVYAIVLLLLGTSRRISSLRWASLSVFVLAIGKVFLHDLGHLEGLYRVASLAGLALSLLAVSLFYQRFVFRHVAAGV